jgi:hypothetical protein
MTMTDTRAFVELVHDGVTGMLPPPEDVASPADRLHRVLADVDRDLRFGDAARSYDEVGVTPALGLAALVAGYEAATASRGLCERL